MGTPKSAITSGGRSTMTAADPADVRSPDRVMGTELAFSCRIGFHEHERDIEQRILVDFDAETDWRSAAATDRPRSLIDYYEVNLAIEAMVKGRSWRLLEALAEDIAALICHGYPVDRVRIRATKQPIDMPNAGSVAVECTRVPADFLDRTFDERGIPLRGSSE